MVLIFVKLARRQLRKLDCLMKHNEVMKNSQFRFFLCRNKLSHFLWLCHSLSSDVAKVIQLGVIQCIIHDLSPKLERQVVLIYAIWEMDVGNAVLESLSSCKSVFFHITKYKNYYCLIWGINIGRYENFFALHKSKSVMIQMYSDEWCIRDSLIT